MSATTNAPAGPCLRVLGPTMLLDPRSGLPLVMRPVVAVLMTALAIRPGEAVSDDELCEWIWPQEPTGSKNRLFVTVSRARTTLEPFKGRISIDRTPDGYRLAISSTDLDIQSFARVADGTGTNDPSRLKAIQSALAWWRGKPFASLPDPAPALSQIHLAELSRLRLTMQCTTALRDQGQIDAALRLCLPTLADHPEHEPMADRFENPPKVRPADRALNAPTSAAWIDPWTAQLLNPPPSTVPGTPTPTKVAIKTGTVDAVVTTLSGTGRRVTSLKVTTNAPGQKTIAVGPNDSVVFAVSLNGARALIASDPGLTAEPELARLSPTGGVKNGNMNGIQFYLTLGSLSGPLIRGHYLLVESSWAITALSQDSRWWKAGAAPTGGILSVIISDWATASPGGKSALASNDDELTTELWRQLREAIPQLPVAKPPYAIDVGMTWNAALGTRVNTEPMLVNTTKSWADRPHAGLTGSVANLVIAGDFVRGITDFASMELANETARRAVNVLLQRDGLTTHPPCKVYDKLEHLSVGALLTAAVKQLSKTAAFAVAKLLGLEPSDTDPNESWWPYEFRSGTDIIDTVDVIFAITDWMDRVLQVDTSTVKQRTAAKSVAATDGPTAEALRFIGLVQDVHRETFTTMEMVYGPAPRKG